MRRVLAIFSVLLLAALLGTGWYAYQKGFTKKWRSYVAGEFRKRGIEVSLRQLALEPFRGIVARDVKVYDTRDRRRTVAVINEVLLVINYANFFKSQPFIEALDLREARLSLPLDSSNARGPAIEVRNLSGRLLLPPKQIYLSRLEADLYGVRLSATGRLVNPGVLKLKGNHGAGLAAPLLARCIEELKALKFEAEAPRLEMHFSGDLSPSGKLFVEGSLNAQRVRRAGYRLETLQINGALRDGVVEMNHLSASDRKGTLSATGRWEVASGESLLRLRSTLDAKTIAMGLEMGTFFEEFGSDAPPLLDVTLQAQLTEPRSLRATAHLALGRFAYRSARFESFEGDASWRDGRWSGRDLRLTHRSGEISGDLMRLPGDFRARLHSTINPRVLTPMLPRQVAEFFSQFDFFDSPTLDLEMRGRELKMEEGSGRGTVKLGRASFRNVPVNGLSAALRYGERRLAIAPFELQRSEGNATGGLIVDLGANEIRLEKIRSALNPAELMPWIAPGLVDAVAGFRFPKQPPELAVEGVIYLHQSKATWVAIDAAAPSGMEVDFWKKPLTIAPLSAKILLGDQRLKIADISGELLGGQLRGKAAISLLRGKPVHNTQLRFENLDFARLLKLYFNEESFPGRLEGSFDLSGMGGETRFLHGHGELTLKEGDLFALPFFKPIPALLGELIPELPRGSIRKAGVGFTFKEGVLVANDLTAEANGFTVKGAGKLMILEDATDFNLRINARGIPGLLLSPDGNLFELVAGEKLSAPRWRLQTPSPP